MGDAPEPMQVSPEILCRYDRPGPRYTSYPPVPGWQENFSADDSARALRSAAVRTDDDLALYVHIPFCHEQCWYCGCNTVVSKKPDIVERFLEYLSKELRLVASHLGERRGLIQLHWGGGTPTYLSPGQMETLYGEIAKHFSLREGAEVALEIDPRCTTLEHLKCLRELGFSRVSMGLQDFDPDVQAAIGRNQTKAQTQQVFQWCRDENFESINVDLIYGLPSQRPSTWEETLRAVVDLHPDRIATYSYAHLPARIKHQKRIDAALLPEAGEKYDLLAAARNVFTEGGYRAIGMDHFADPNDDLAIALSEGRLHRNFMGYTTIATSETIGIGPSAIGNIGGVYAQNEKRLVTYYRHLDEDRLPVAGGHVLSKEDELRGGVIQRLMCTFAIDYAEIEDTFGVSFESHFEKELDALREFAEQGFVTIGDSGIVVDPLGQVFVRNLAMIFDAYLTASQQKTLYSRTV